MSGAVIFDPNVPVEVAFLEETYLPEQESVIYTLTDGRTMRVPASAAASINMMDITIGETFMVCRYSKGERKQPSQWSVWLTPESEKARAKREEPLIERQLRQSIAEAGTRRAGEAVAAEKIEAMQAGVPYPQTCAPADSQPPRTAIITPPAPLSPAPIPISGSVSRRRPAQRVDGGISARMALRHVLRFCKEELAAAQVQMGSAEFQDLVTTFLIPALQSGRVQPLMMEEEEVQDAAASPF